MTPRPGEWLVRRPIALARLGLLLLPLLTGCGARVRCIHWNDGEGVCPAPALAERTFREVEAGCDSVESVDSDAEFDGDSCCYEVTEADACGARR